MIWKRMELGTEWSSFGDTVMSGGCLSTASTFFASIDMLEKPIRRFNFNPWKAHVGDCAIRAVCAAIGMRYELVCKEFGVSWKRGKGLIRDTGIDL